MNSVQAVMVPRERILWAAPDEPLPALLERLIAADVNQMPVVQHSEDGIGKHRGNGDPGRDIASDPNEERIGDRALGWGQVTALRPTLRALKTLALCKGALFVAKRDDWVNEHRTARRNVRRQEHN